MSALAAGPLWPLLVYGAAVVGVALAIIAISYLLGERHRERATGLPYESGMIPTGEAHYPFPVEFYLVAVFFVIFDLEAVFLFAWAVALRQVGWAGYVEALIFIGVLGAALVYLWRLGALDWGTSGEDRRDADPSGRVLPAPPASGGVPERSEGGVGASGEGKNAPL